MRRIFSIVFFLLISLPALQLPRPIMAQLFHMPLKPKNQLTFTATSSCLTTIRSVTQWRKFNIYFDGGFSHFWITNTPYFTTLNIFSAAPVIRYTFRRRGPVLPFLEFSIGLAYLNHTRLDDRNLGIHFAFQDRFGIGAFLGPSDNLTLGLHAVHYSNAHLSAHNSGITIPVVLDIGYRFPM